MPVFTSPRLRRHFSSLLLSVLPALVAHDACAQTVFIKDNNTSALDTQAAWVGLGSPPVFTNLDTMLWNNTVTGANTVNLLTGAGTVNLGQLAVQNPGGPVTINIGAGNTLNLSGVAGTGIDLSTSTQNLTLSLGTLGVAAAQNWLVNAGRNLTVTSAVGLGANTLTLGSSTATGQVTINGVISGSKAASSTALSIAGGTTYFTGLNTYTGQTLIASGATAMAGINSSGAANSAFGAGGAGNEVIVQSGGTLNVGGSNLGSKIVQIAGTGVGGQGALTNTGQGQTNALQFLTLTANATVSAVGTTINTSANGNSYGRLDVRAASYTAGAKNLDLAGNTLTKTGGSIFSLINADVTAGNFAVSNGILRFEGTTILGGTAANTITVNNGGRLGVFNLPTGPTLTLVLNTGSQFGEDGSNAASVYAGPITIAGQTSFNSLSGGSTNSLTLSGKISSTGGTSFDKRGAGSVFLTNQTNDFNLPINIYQGLLRADFTTAATGGVAPSAPVALSGTPLGTDTGAIMIRGGTLGLRFNAANDSTAQVVTLGRGLTIDNAPGALTLDRIGNATQTDKSVLFTTATPITFAPSSAANGWSIGQNQLTVSQANTHRPQIGSMVINNDTNLVSGDFVFTDGSGGTSTTGGVVSSMKNTVLHLTGSSIGTVGGTHQFGAFYQLGGNMRIGSMYGTAQTSSTATLGTGPIYIGPNANATFRTPTNIAAGQTVDLLSQGTSYAVFQLEQTAQSSVSSAVRALGSGVYAVGSGGYNGTLNLSKIGNGTLFLGTGYQSGGNATVSGTILPGAGNQIRLGSAGTMTVNSINGLGGAGSTAAVVVGSELVHGAIRNAGGIAMSGTLLVTNTNSYSGGTIINRGSTVNLQTVGGLGSGTVDVFGTLTLSGANGSLVSGGAATNVVNVYGGGAITLDNTALTTTVDINRWNDTTGISLNAASFTVTNRNGATVNTTETVGAITFAGGSSIFPNRANNIGSLEMRLTAGGLTRVGTGTLEISRAGNSGFGSTTKFLVSSGAPTVTNGLVSPYISLIDATQLTTFASYNASTGFVVPAYTAVIGAGSPGGTFTTGFTAGTELLMIDFASGTTTLTLGDNPIINAMKVGAGTSATTINSSGSFNTITLRSGGLIISGDATGGRFSTGTGTATINPGLTFNDGTANIEAVINVRSGNTAVLNGPITANGLTKFGGGTLNLTANNSATLSGTASVNQGILQLFGTTTTNANHNPAGTGTLLMNGGQLNLRAANIVGTSFSTSNNGSYTLQNDGITVAENIPLAVVDLNRATADTTSAGSITINPATTGLGLVLKGVPGAQGQTFTVQGGNYGLTIGANGINTFTGNVTINNAITFTLANGVNVTDPNTTIIKSGTGSWVVGSSAGATSVAANTTIALNVGTLDLRSLTAFGTGAGTGGNGTQLVLNGGTLNLRRDTSAGVFGGSATTPYAVTVNGSTIISTDRISAGSGYALGLGKLTINGSPTVTLNNANTVYPTFAGAQFNGLAFIASNVSPTNNLVQMPQFQSGFDISGGGLVKTGAGHLHLINANSTYDGGTYINQGVLRASGINSIGTGKIVLNPAGALSLEGANNFNSATQSLTVYSNSSFLPVVSVRTDVAHPTTGVDTSGAKFGIIGVSNTTGGVYNTPINLSTLYGGYWSLGALGSSAYDGRYTAATLGAGAENLYRIGGGGATFVINLNSSGASINNVLTGNNGVRFGFDTGSVLGGSGGNSLGNYQIQVRGNNNYTGNTTIHRGVNVRIDAAPSGGFTGLSNTAVDVFGAFVIGGAATLVNGTSHYNAVTLHPGSTLQLDRTGSATNMWQDTTAMSLNGAALDVMAPATGGVTTAETIGAVTISRGARISLRRLGNGTSGAGPNFNNGVLNVTLDGLTGLTAGNTLAIQHVPGALGVASPNATGANGGADRLFVNGTPPTVTNGMVDPRIVSQTDNTFLTYGANGFAPVTYDNTFTTSGTLTAGLSPTAKVDINSAGTMTLGDNATVYALRTNRDIAIGGPFNQLTLRSGGLISFGNALTIQPNVVFNDGTQNIEARIFTGSNLTLNGTLTAAAVTKFGTGTLTINQPQPDYSGGWTVNAGTLTINDPNGLGQSVPGNGVTLNAYQTTGGNGVTTGPLNLSGSQTQLTFSRDSGSPELVTFTGGPITVVNEATIRIAGANDRNIQIPNVVAVSTGTQSSSAVTFDVPSNRFRAIVPTLTASSNAVLRIFDSSTTTDTGRITALAVNSLVGSNVAVIKTGNRTLELTEDNSSTFTGGAITISMGAVRVRDNGSLGSASTAVVVERNAVLEISASNYTPLQTSFTQMAGSIERWNVQDARGTGTYNLPAGVNLQLNTNLQNTQTIGLNGGTIEGFLYSDHVAQAADRIVGSGVTINLLASSMVGQNILQGQGYDLGRQPTVFQPFANTYTGTILRIEGNITGSSFDLTKTGLDTVVLSGTGNTYRNTIVEMGLLRIGATNALPTGGALTTRLSGMFDLYGYDQTVAGLGTVTGGVNPGGVSVGSSGSLVNSAAYDSTLTISGSTDYTYNGLIDMNVALTKQGSSTQILGNGANTYRGATTLKEGVLQVSALANGGSASSIGQSSNAAANLVFDGGTLRYVGTTPGVTDRQITLGDSGGTLDSSSALAGNGVNFTSTTAVTHTGTADDARTLTFTGTNTGTNTFAAPIGNNGAGIVGVTKDGIGSWTLSGSSTYTGTTLVNAGTLNLTGSIANSAVIDVKTTATFDVSGVGGGFTLGSTQTLTGTGTVAGPMTNDGTISPGALTGTTIGTLTINNDLVFGSGSVANFEIGGLASFDRLIGIDDFTLDGTVNVTFANGFLPTAAGQIFDLIDWVNLVSSSGFNVNNDLFLPDLAGLSGNQLDWDRSEFTTSGRLVVVDYVPEPSRAVLLLLGLLGILARRRRQA